MACVAVTEVTADSPGAHLARHSDEQKANKQKKQKANRGQDKPSGLS